MGYVFFLGGLPGTMPKFVEVVEEVWRVKFGASERSAPSIEGKYNGTERTPLFMNASTSEPARAASTL